MKNVLLLVHDDPGQEARLQSALDLCRAMGGHLNCLDVAEIPVIAGDVLAVQAEAFLARHEQEVEAANRRRIERRVAAEGVSWSWIDVTGHLATELIKASKLADVIVVSRRLDEALVPDMRAVAGDVVISSGNLVVVVPEKSRGLKLAGHALVAWNGTAAAAHAVKAAVPLLKLASRVTVVEINDDSVQVPAEDAAAYLSRHGVKAVVIHRQPCLATTSKSLTMEARIEQADYLVMGGYGQPRVLEAIFGGVTRDMLTDSPIPVMMAH